MMNQMYGFDGEVKAKYTAQMAELFTEVYNWLPLAHCLNNRVLVSMLINLPPFLVQKMFELKYRYKNKLVFKSFKIKKTLNFFIPLIFINGD